MGMRLVGLGMGMRLAGTGLDTCLLACSTIMPTDVLCPVSANSREGVSPRFHKQVIVLVPIVTNKTLSEYISHDHITKEESITEKSGQFKQCPLA